MSQITKFQIAGLLLIAGLLFTAGCGSERNADSPFDTDDDQHVAGWLPAGHKTAALADEAPCAECHGSDLSGGTSNISCTMCHLRGVNSVHPLDWGTSIVQKHGSYVDTNGSTACANVSCHGTNLGGVIDSGPACTSCHVNGFPTTLTGCTSCHDAPPTGTTYPNISGAHAAHNALPNVASVCDTCHNGGGAGTTNHNTGTVYTQFLGIYNAKSGTATYNAADGTCSKVSCHGGQTTPAWLTGTIDVNTQCLACHELGTSQYNSFVSGQHYYHVIIREWNAECWRCHDFTKLADVHFKSLETTTLDGQASSTLQSFVNYDKTAMTCNAICHPGIRIW